MTDPTSKPRANQLTEETVTYEDARVSILPEAPYHYHVEVNDPDGDNVFHAVEYVVINGADVSLDDPIVFSGVKLEVGIPIGDPGDTAWVWV